MNVENLKFVTPFTMLVSGPSGSGKTNIVRKILEYHSLLISPSKKLIHVLWAYGQWQNLYSEKIQNVFIEYLDGLPSENEINSKKPDMIIIDDLMNELGNDIKLANLFTKVSHHKKISVIFLTQNLFHQGRQMRNIHLSSHYLILMKNTRDASQVDHLGRQLKMIKELSEAYKDATNVPFGYIIIDFKQETPRDLMMRTRIFPDETINGMFSPIIYIPK